MTKDELGTTPSKYNRIGDYFYIHIGVTTPSETARIANFDISLNFNSSVYLFIYFVFLSQRYLSIYDAVKNCS